MKIITITGCSGSGKNYFAEKLISFLKTQGKNAQFITSLTTRKPRQGEIDGKDYHFVTEEQFKAYIESGRLLEYVKVNGNYYGTPLIENTDTLFVHIVEPKGVISLISQENLALTSIFLFVDNAELIHHRLNERIKNAIDEKEKLAHKNRLSQLEFELSHWNKIEEHYHFVYKTSELANANFFNNALKALSDKI